MCGVNLQGLICGRKTGSTDSGIQLIFIINKWKIMFHVNINWKITFRLPWLVNFSDTMHRTLFKWWLSWATVARSPSLSLLLPPPSSSKLTSWSSADFCAPGRLEEICSAALSSMRTSSIVYSGLRSCTSLVYSNLKQKLQ